MDIRQLKSLVAVLDYGGFSAAAAALGTVQSNVSTHVSKLEAEVGSVLFDRRTGNPTPEGLIVAARSRRLLSELEAIKSDISAARGDLRGRVRVGMIGTTARWLIPLLVTRAQRVHPNLGLEISEGTSSVLQSWVSVGRVDLALINRPIGMDEVDFSPLFTEALVLLVKKNHRLATAHSVSIRDLAGIELLVPPKGTGFRDELDAVAATCGVRITPKAEVDGLRLIAALALDGFGPAILPSSAIPHYLQDKISAIAISDLAPRQIGVARRTKALDSSTAKATIQMLDDILADTDTAIPNGIVLSRSRR